MGFVSEELSFALDTPLGADELLVESFVGREQISGLFHFELDLVSENHGLNLDDVVGKPVCLSMLAGEERRFVSGVARSIAQLRQGVELTHFRMEVVPWLWRLTLTTDCRIFQHKTVPEIVAEILDEHGPGLHEWRVTRDCRRREYCVQYRESDFHFVSRLLEEEGIFYFFAHGDGEHTLILADGPDGMGPVQGGEEVQYASTASETQTEERVTEVVWEQRVRPTAQSLQDYNFETPSTDLEVSVSGTDGGEIFDFPGRYGKRDEGETYARVRWEVEAARTRWIGGKTTSRRLVPGYRMALVEHPREEFNQSLAVVSVAHVGRQDVVFERRTRGEGWTYEARFESIPVDTPFRPEQRTQKPCIAGCQTAIVVGPAGEEIWLDKYGRVKVHFYWDRRSKRNEGSSCWIRVSQSWAGKNWGAVFHPRIGQEVIVEFLEGDPDRPIITGRVYNEEQMPPYALPDAGTRSTVKSRSSKGGGADNFNEIRFEDAKGQEEIYIHAEKNEKIVVENDKREEVGRDESIEIGNDRTEVVVGNEDLTVRKNRSRVVQLNELINVLLSRTHTVGVNEAIVVGAAQEIVVGAARAVTVGSDQVVIIGQGLTEEVGEDQSTSVGKKLSIDAGDQIEIKTGEASILMKKDGTIRIKGKDILVQGSGNIVEKADGTLVLKATQILQN